MRLLPCTLMVAVVLSVTSRAYADEAAPLPSKDIRWSVAVRGAVDAGSMPRAAPGIALGFDVRRGALGLRIDASAFVAQVDRRSDVSVGLFDAMATICALAPIGDFLDVGACGGGGAGLLRAGSVDVFRPQGLAIARADLVLVRGLLLATLDAGTVVDPLRTELSLGAGDPYRASSFSFRSSLGLLFRLW
jgi:hypothetical protein